MSQAEFDAYVDEYDAQHAASVRLSDEDSEGLVALASLTCSCSWVGFG